MRDVKIYKRPGVMLFLAFSFLSGYCQEEADAREEIVQYRAKQEATFRNTEESPLLPGDRRKFKGLHYYPVDLAYRVPARFIRNESPVFFKMKTTTTRLPEYVKYGEVHFTVNNQPCSLEVYQSPEITQRPGYEDYLFIPFTDLTNGPSTYEGGRYMEFRIPASEDVIIDFNKAYNPYCSYNPKYSCPIPPQANHLSLAVEAGEKKFKKKGR